MTEEKAKRILKEFARRKAQADDVLSNAFPEQHAFITDTAKQRVALCSRRAGKSYATALCLLHEALTHPGATCLYVTLTIGTARKILERNIFYPVLKQHSIPHKFNYTQSHLELYNGSRIYMLGGDAKPDEWKKFLGQKYNLVVIDECGSFKQDLRNIVDSIKPALADLDGSIVMVGTPEINTHFKGQPTLFYAASEGLEKGWSVHKWNALNNPHINWQKTIDDEEAKNPHFKETTTYKRYYLGQWVIDDSARVYRFDRIRNSIPTIPSIKDAIYVLGIDLGHTDATAFVLTAFSPYERRLYVIHTFKRSKMIDDDVIAYIDNLRKDYPISRFIVDPASKQLIESMRYRSQIPFESADKIEKNRYIDILNSDLLTQKIQLVAPVCEPLIKEMNELTWTEDSKGKRTPNPSCADHLCDAFLYAWRFAKYYHALPQEKPKPSPDEEMSNYWENKRQAIQTQKDEDKEFRNAIINDRRLI